MPQDATELTFPGDIADGIGHSVLKGWDAIREFLDKRTDFTHVIWRGQRRESWKLQATLDRSMTFANKPPAFSYSIIRSHLEGFQFACRGRRGVFARELTEDEWWSLGQHFGLATPLLDWTVSPFVALFFAFAKPSESPEESRVLYGLKYQQLSSKLPNDNPVPYESQKEFFRIVRPLTDDNPRLVSQNGLFTRAHTGADLEEMVKKHCGTRTGAVMYKIRVAGSERSHILKALNRMNINYLSLFPDLTGASLFCNHRLSIDRY